MQDCNACYCIAIVHLIKHPGDAAGAVEAAEAWASKSAVTEVQDWLADSERPGADFDCPETIGFVKWGFTYAFRSVFLHVTLEMASIDICMNKILSVVPRMYGPQGCPL